MNKKGKIFDPIIIKLSYLGNEILSSGNGCDSYPLEPGAVFGEGHYGFIIIVDKSDKQSHVLYPTDSCIQAAGIENGKLKVFEENKKFPREFNFKGNILNTDDLENYENNSVVFDNASSFEKGARLANPISIKINANPHRSSICVDEEEFPIYPGVMFGSINHGFIVEIDTGIGVKYMVYPTQEKIIGIGSDFSCFNDFKVFEEGKYHPWNFSYMGEFISEATFEPNSRRDNEYIEDHYTTLGDGEIRMLEKKTIR